MIKEKDLSELRPQVRFQDGKSIDLETIQGALMDCANSHDIPITFTRDEVKFGGLIGGHTEDCLVLYHPEHEKDYFHYVITVGHQSSYAFVSVFVHGESKQLKKQDAAAAAKAGAKNVGKSAVHGILNHDDSIGGMFTGAFGMAKGTVGLAKSISKGISAIGGSKEKLAVEQNWYVMIADVFDEIIS